MSCRVTRAETEKAWMAVDVNDRTAKNRKNRTIDFEKRSFKPTGSGCLPAGAAFAFFGTASSCRLFHWVASAATTSRPNNPAEIRAVRHPKVEARRIIAAGAAAEPRWPEKVCT